MRWVFILLLIYQLHLTWPRATVRQRAPEFWDGRLLIRHRLPIYVLPGVH